MTCTSSLVIHAKSATCSTDARITWKENAQGRYWERENLCHVVLRREQWMQNLALAAQDLCWENEEQKLLEIYRHYD